MDFRVNDGRLYINTTDNSTNDLNKLVNESSREIKGASVRCYTGKLGRIKGKILSCFGYATEVTVNNEKYYVNNKSLAKFVIRNFETPPRLASDGQSAVERTMKKLHNCYLQHQARGDYNERHVDTLAGELPKLAKENGENFQDILGSLIHKHIELRGQDRAQKLNEDLARYKMPKQ